MNISRWFAHLLLLLSNVLFACGLFAPCMTILPAFGSHTTMVLLFEPKFGEPVSMSIAGGIITLLSEGKQFIGLLILVFSVLFPLWKFGVLWSGIIALDSKQSVHAQLKLIEKLGKFSMLDIFVLAVLILALKGLPGGTQVQIEWGIYAFAVSILLTLRLPVWLERLDSQRTAL